MNYKYKVGDIVKARHRIYSSHYKQVKQDDFGIVIEKQYEGKEPIEINKSYKVYFFKYKFTISPYESQIYGLEEFSGRNI